MAYSTSKQKLANLIQAHNQVIAAARSMFVGKNNCHTMYQVYETLRAYTELNEQGWFAKLTCLSGL